MHGTATLIPLALFSYVHGIEKEDEERSNHGNEPSTSTHAHIHTQRQQKHIPLTHDAYLCVRDEEEEPRSS